MPKQTRQTIKHMQSCYAQRNAKKTKLSSSSITRSKSPFTNTTIKKSRVSSATCKKSPSTTHHHTKSAIGSGNFDEFDGWLVETNSSNRKDYAKTKLLIMPPSKNGTPIDADKDWVKHVIGSTTEAKNLKSSLHYNLI